MNLTIFQVDAFADKTFSGNPAAVVPLEYWLPDEILQNIAMENNLSETAFFVPEGKNFHIRWFTPVSEVNLCGHATLATAHVLFEMLDYYKPQIVFSSKSGMLKVRKEHQIMILDFPVSEIIKTDTDEVAAKIFGIPPLESYRGREDLMFVFKTEDQVKNLTPDTRLMKTIGTRGFIATAPSDEYDFVSRFFAPSEGIDEDPVTGSAHTMLIPYWAGRLNKENLLARQVSKRGGIIHCTNAGDRVFIGGKAVTYLHGEIFV